MQKCQVSAWMATSHCYFRFFVVVVFMCGHFCEFAVVETFSFRPIQKYCGDIRLGISQHERKVNVWAHGWEQAARVRG